MSDQMFIGAYRASCVYALVLNLFLIGCGSSPDKPEPLPTDPVKVSIDKRLLEECAELPRLKSSRDVDVLDHERVIISEYFKCAASKKALSSEIRKAFNLDAN